ncbi:Ornithine decarboxylase 1B, chloroplastic [Linum grandiflorum]
MVAVLTSGLQGIITAPGVKGRSVTSLSDGALTDFLRSIIKDSDTGGEPEPFYVLDLGIVDSLVDAWSKSLPMVHPFYAVKSVFDTAIRLGLPRMHMLDIGGGFTSGSQFEDAATEIRAALDDYFSEEPGLKVISEPGRFFSETAFTLAATIIGKRVRGGQREYWINDGLYVISNPGDPTCQVPATYSSTVFGPTCDALDTVFTGRLLPDLKVNDWLVFPDMGAYTAAAGSNFNGFNADRILTHLAYSTTVNHN